MRNPTDPRWPEEGERTSSREIAERWKWAYHALVRGEHRRRVLGIRGPQKPIAELAERYLAERLETVARSTWSADRTAMKYLLEDFADRSPLEVTQAELRSWLLRMLRQDYRPNTLRTYLTSMRVFFKTFGADPVHGLTVPDPGKQDVRFWTDAECEKLREAASKVDTLRVGNFAPCRLAIEVGLSMGLRQGEIFGLRWEDIREREKVVRVDRQTEKDRKGTKPLKGKLSRTALVLPSWWEHHERRIGWVLGPVGSRTQRNMIERVLDTAGLNEMGIGWHSLRHTYAANYLLSRGSIFGLQKSLGHSSVKITEDRYSHLASDRVAAIERGAVYGA